MTGSAGKRRMFAQQWKAGQRVIEGHLFLPPDRIVATCAIGSELALVDIVIGMTAYTGHRKLYDAGWLFMAGVAGERLVRPAQREPRHRVVIEAVLLPVATIVAACAIGAVAALVDIVLHMTGDAGPRRLPDRVAHAMARGATRCRMFPDKGKAGVRVMIERRRLPARRRMAACAVGSARAFVHIVPGMARDALGGGSGPALACMARKAGGRSVSAGQGKAGRSVVEGQGLFPAVNGVAGLAILAEPSKMRVLPGMASCACGRNAAEVFACSVASCTGGASMAAE